MEINKITSSNLNLPFNQISPRSSYNHFYENTIKGNSCSNSSPKCCISHFFMKLGEIIAYPFVKFYEFLTSLCKKNSKKIEEITEKSKEESVEEPSNEESRESIEFNGEFFYECGKMGITTRHKLDARIAQGDKVIKAHQALESTPSLLIEWQKGIAYYLGTQGRKLYAYLATDSQYVDQYTEGKKSYKPKEETLSYTDPGYLEPKRFTEEFFYNSGKEGKTDRIKLYASIPDIPGRYAATHALGWHQHLVQAWDRGSSFYFGFNNLPLPNQWQSIDFLQAEYAKGKMAAALVTRV